MILNLQPGESRPFPTAARFLNVLAASAPFIISNHDKGLPDTTVKSGWIVDVQDYTSIDVTNPNTRALALELQCSALRIQANGGDSVEVSNAVVVQRINEPLSVTANATLEGGFVGVLAANRHIALSTQTIAPGQTVKLCDARAEVGRRAVIQVLSADDAAAQVRISHEGPAESSGLLLMGSAIAPAMHQWEAETPIYVRNTGTVAAIVTGAEFWRQDA